MADDNAPDWITALVDEQSEVLVGLLGLPRTPFIELHDQGPTAISGQRIIEAEARQERIIIRLAGDWAEESRDARRQVVGNLAHELAHVWQHTLGVPGEDFFFHEGFAEAIAYDVLLRCGIACDGEPETLLRFQRRDCANALRHGALIAQDSRAAAYGCGAVLALAAANAAGTTPQKTYRAFAATDRTHEDFLAVARQLAGQPFSTSAFIFLHTDYRLAPPESVMDRLCEGKL